MATAHHIALSRVSQKCCKPNQLWSRALVENHQSVAEMGPESGGFQFARPVAAAHC